MATLMKNSYQIPAGLAVEAAEHYQMVPTRRDKEICMPTGQTVFSPQDPINFVVTSANSFLDLNETKLKFDYMALNADNRPDGSANSVINRVIVEAGSVIIEDIRNYNVCFQCLADLEFGPDLRGTNLCRTQGFSPAVTHSTLITAAPTIIQTFIDYENGAPLITTNSIRSYEISIMGLLSQSKWYLPLMFMPPLNITLYLERENIVCVTDGADTTASYQLLNVQLKIEKLTFEGNTMLDYAALVAGDMIKLPFTTWVNFSMEVPAGSTVTQEITQPYTFLNSTLTIMRNNTAQLNVQDRRTRKISARTSNTATQYQMMIGQRNYPSRPVPITSNNLGEAFDELMKSINFNLLNILSSGNIIESGFNPNLQVPYDKYYITAASGQILEVAPTTLVYGCPTICGKFIIGVNLSAHPSEGKSTGLNTASSHDHIRLDITATVPAGGCRVDTWLNIDKWIHILPSRNISMQE